MISPLCIRPILDNDSHCDYQRGLCRGYRRMPGLYADHYMGFGSDTPSPLQILLPNDILTPLQPYPDFMNLSGRHIDSVSDAKCIFLYFPVVKRSVIRRISDGKSASSD